MRQHATITISTSIEHLQRTRYKRARAVNWHFNARGKFSRAPAKAGNYRAREIAAARTIDLARHFMRAYKMPRSTRAPPHCHAPIPSPPRRFHLFLADSIAQPPPRHHAARDLQATAASASAPTAGTPPRYSPATSSSALGRSGARTRRPARTTRRRGAWRGPGRR